MKKWLGVIIAAALLLGACASGRVSFRGDFDFANKLAENGLWQEAYYRWQRVLAQGMDTAAVHNNMALALEKMARWAEAEAEYQKALKLAPTDSHIKGNYEKCKRLREKGEVGHEK